MRGRLLFLFAFAALATISSCRQEGGGQGDVTPEEGLQEISFEVGAPDLKTTISGGTVTWSASDQLSVFDDEPQFLRQFTNQKGAVSAAIFKGEARIASQYKVVYPYQSGSSCSGNVVTMGTGLANTQTMPAGGGFAANTVPAAGKVNLTGTSSLTDIVALLKFTIPEEQTSVQTVRFNAGSGQKLSGKFTVDLASTPTLSPAASGTYSYVTTNTHASHHAPGTYYLAVFPGTYSGCSVVVNGNDTRTISGSKTFAAGKIYDLGEITYTGPGDSRDLTVTFLPAETSTKASSGIPWVAPASSTVAYCTNTDAGFATAAVTVNGSGKLQFTASSLPKNTKQLWIVYPAQDNSGKNWASKTLTVPAAQTSNATGDFLLDNYPFAIKLDVGQDSALDFTYSLNGAAGDSREESNATIVKFDLSNSLYSASGYDEKFTGVTCGGVTTTFSGATQCTLTSAYMAMDKAASASYAFSVNGPYQAGYTYASQTIDTSSGNIMSFEPQCSSRIVCVRSGDNIQTRLDACKPQKAYSKVTANDEMRIAAGTFTVASNIVVRSGINVAGGYTATSTAPFITQGANILTKINGNNSVRCVYSAALGSATTWSNLELMNGAGAVNGAGIYVSTNLNLSNCYIYNCISSTNGGGIYLEGGGGNTITGCTVENCSVTGDSSLGGGAVLGAACSFTGNTITGCSSAYRAGGIYATSGTGVSISGGSITGCTAANYGGGLFSNGTTAVSGTTISGCSGSIGGGAFMNASGGNLTSCNISGNNTTSGRGGGLYLNSGTTATSCNIYGNTSAQHGGGVAGYNSGKLVNCTVYGNTAASTGGGVYWSGNTTINANVIEGGTIGGTSLAAGQRNYSTSHGGGVYIDASAVQAKVSGVTIKYNQSAATCGGIYAANGSAATITGCTVDHNKGGGTTWGGGVYCYGGTVTSTTISYNDAGAGGGMYARDATLSGLTIHHNTASKAWDAGDPTASSGGGMYCNNCTISGTMTVYSNTANGRGGGAYLISGTTWSGSSSTDIYSNTSNAPYDGSAFQDGGGGLWIAGGVTVHGSSATSLMKIRSNTASGYGGGANVLGKLYYAEVYSNKATRGGGLLLYATASRDIFNGGGKTQNGFCYNSCIRSNTASGIGGGVYMYGSSYMCLNLIIRNTSSSTGNTGFGVYEYSGATGANTAPMVINCSVIHNTRTSSDITPGTNSAGIYINNTSASGVGYLYNTVSRYGYSNKDIYTVSNCSKGSIIGCHYRTLTRAASTQPAVSANITDTTAEADLFATTTSTATSYLVKTSALYNSKFDTGSGSGIVVGTYFPITKDYYGTSISGTIYTIGCEVKFKTP